MCLVCGGGVRESMEFIEYFGEETLGRIKKGNIKMCRTKADGFI